MRLTFSAALLALLVATPAYALQEPDKDKEKPAQEEPKKEEPKKQEPDRQQPQEKEKQQQDKAQADKARQTDKQQQIEKAKPDKPAPEHPQQAQGGNGNRTIKETDFRAHFGRQHTFRVARRDDRRFNYGGYWFVYNDPWPAGWSYSDAVYVDEIDGQYYLIDPVHPGIQLLIVVSD